MMNPHVYLLGFLIGSSGIESSLSFSVKPTPPLYSAPCSHSQQHLHPLLVQQWPFVRHQDHGQYHRRCSPLSTPTTMHARRGGRGRRRGRTDSYDTAAAVIAGERPAKQQQQRQGAAGEATLAVQHAADEDLPRVAHDHLAVLRPGVLCQALLRIAKHLVQEAKMEARNELLKNPTLLALFMAASAPAAVTTTDPGGRPGLSAPQAADIVWACGLLRWRPSDDQRLGQLVEIVAKAARSDGDLDGWHVTNVVWALDRLGALAPAASVTVAAAREEEEEKAVIGGGDRGTRLGFRGASEELRERVALLPFRAIPSLFEGLRVEDFREEVAFGRDEILLGGGKVLSESRLTAWQSSDGLPFAYSGKVMEPLPFSPNVLRLRDALYERTGVLYDGVLLNLYESRSSAMRYHSDPDVGTVWTQDTSVVSVGDTRQFALRETLDHTRRHSFYLSSGDCVRMTAGCQRDYQHCVKVAKDEVGPRISLVFKQSIAGLQHLKE